MKKNKGLGDFSGFVIIARNMSVAVAQRNSQSQSQKYMPRSATNTHSPMDSKKGVIKIEGSSHQTSQTSYSLILTHHQSTIAITIITITITITNTITINPVDPSISSSLPCLVTVSSFELDSTTPYALARPILLHTSCPHLDQFYQSGPKSIMDIT